MTPGAKMLLMAREGGDKRRTEHDGYNYPREDYDGARMGYGGYSAYPYREREYPDMTYNGDAEARFRDRQGREHYDNGRYAPKGAMEPEDYPESRRYRRDDAGRFRSEYNPIVPPVYRGDRPMNRIGFAAGREIDSNYPMDANYPRMEEVGHRTSMATMGHAKAADMVLTEEMAHEWMHNLQNTDGSKGPHWTMEQIKQVMSQKGIKADPLELWVAMNASYSDLCALAKKHGINNIDFYLDYSMAFWLQDKDAVDDKEAAYYMYVTKK